MLNRFQSCVVQMVYLGFDGVATTARTNEKQDDNKK